MMPFRADAGLPASGGEAQPRAKRLPLPAAVPFAPSELRVHAALSRFPAFGEEQERVPLLQDLCAAVGLTERRVRQLVRALTASGSIATRSVRRGGALPDGSWARGSRMVVRVLGPPRPTSTSTSSPRERRGSGEPRAPRASRASSRRATASAGSPEAGTVKPKEAGNEFRHDEASIAALVRSTLHGFLPEMLRQVLAWLEPLVRSGMPVSGMPVLALKDLEQKINGEISLSNSFRSVSSGLDSQGSLDPRDPPKAGQVPASTDENPEAFDDGKPALKPETDAANNAGFVDDGKPALGKPETDIAEPAQSAGMGVPASTTNDAEQSPLAEFVATAARTFQPHWRWPHDLDELVAACVVGLDDTAETREGLQRLLVSSLTDLKAKCFKYVFSPAHFRMRLARQRAAEMPAPTIPDRASPLVRHALEALLPIRPSWLRDEQLVDAAEECLEGFPDTPLVREALAAIVKGGAKSEHVASPLYVFSAAHFRTRLAERISELRSELAKHDHELRVTTTKLLARCAPHAVKRMPLKQVALLLNEVSEHLETGTFFEGEDLEERLRALARPLEERYATELEAAAEAYQARVDIESSNLLVGTPNEGALEKLRANAKQEPAARLGEQALTRIFTRAIIEGNGFGPHREEADFLAGWTRFGSCPPMDPNAFSDEIRVPLVPVFPSQVPARAAVKPRTLDDAPSAPVEVVPWTAPSAVTDDEQIADETSTAALAAFLFGLCRDEKREWNAGKRIQQLCVDCTANLEDTESTRALLREVVREAFADGKGQTFLYYLDPQHFSMRVADKQHKMDQRRGRALALVSEMQGYLFLHSPSEERIEESLREAQRLLDKGAFDEPEVVRDLMRDLREKLAADRKAAGAMREEERVALAAKLSDATVFATLLKAYESGRLPPDWPKLKADAERLLASGAYGAEADNVRQLVQEVGRMAARSAKPW